MRSGDFSARSRNRSSDSRNAVANVVRIVEHAGVSTEVDDDDDLPAEPAGLVADDVPADERVDRVAVGPHDPGSLLDDLAGTGAEAAPGERAADGFDRLDELVEVVLHEPTLGMTDELAERAIGREDARRTVDGRDADRRTLDEPVDRLERISRERRPAGPVALAHTHPHAAPLEKGTLLSTGDRALPRWVSRRRRR